MFAGFFFIASRFPIVIVSLTQQFQFAELLDVSRWQKGKKIYKWKYISGNNCQNNSFILTHLSVTDGKIFRGI